MSVADWGLLIAVIGLPTSIVTLAIVLRTEIRQRRRWPLIMWSFSRYGTRSVNGKITDELAELVQYGGGPTRVSWFHCVGFRVEPEEGARLRAYIRGEDRLPLFVRVTNPDHAWLVIGHTPRDNTKWLTVEWVPLEPMGKQLEAEFDARWERHIAERRTVRFRVRRLWRRLASRPIIEPVGPSGAKTARLRISPYNSADQVRDVETIMSLAVAADPDSGTMMMR